MDDIKNSMDILAHIAMRYFGTLSLAELQAIYDGISALKTIDDMYNKGKEIKNND